MTAVWARQTFPDAHIIDLIATVLPAFEAKPACENSNQRFPTPRLAGLRAVGELPRLTRRLLVYLSDRHLRTDDGIDVWPLNRFAAALSLWP